MPVTVSLFDLVRLADTREVWPEEFRSFVAAMEEKPDDRTPFGACADWCDEYKEEWLARAFRYLTKRPSVEVKLRDPNSNYPYWSINGLPSSVQGIYVSNVDVSTLAGAVCELAMKLKKAHEDLE